MKFGKYNHDVTIFRYSSIFLLNDVIASLQIEFIYEPNENECLWKELLTYQFDDWQIITFIYSAHTFFNAWNMLLVCDAF